MPISDREVSTMVTAWFARSARALPWRTTPRQPWAALVSEVMAQQTQIARVVERFPAFMARFPSPAHLARADEQEVLALWRGMGYYRRARLLHAAARAIVQQHAGEVPAEVTALRVLPGVGRYTAGAVASIAFGRAEPIVDGNVARVLLRLHARVDGPGEPRVDAWLWQRADDLVHAAGSPGAFNEGLMELGATVCVPKSPQCGSCPLASCCMSNTRGIQHEIPSPKPRSATPTIHALALLATDRLGRILLEQRPPRGMWASLWQVPTLESVERPSPANARRWAGGPVGRSVLKFDVKTTHRLVRVDVRRVIVTDPARTDAMTTSPQATVMPREWLNRAEAEARPKSNPQHRILGLLDADAPARRS